MERAKALEEKIEEVTPPEPGWIQKWVSGYQPPTLLNPVGTTAEEKFKLYGAWSQMAGKLAEAPAEEPRGWWSTVAGQYATGKFPYGEYLKRRKVEEFQGLQMGRLGEIAANPEAEPELKSRLYGEMFTISMGRGEFGKAKGYMDKALDEMINAMKKQAGVELKNSGSLTEIALNTKKIEQNTRGMDKSSAPSAPSTPSEPSAQTQTVGESILWTEDELSAEVRRALGE